MRKEWQGLWRGVALALWAQAACWSPALLAAPSAGQASGVFINMRGDVLTARHAVNDCASLFVLKNGRTAPATVLAVSNEIDAAVLSVALRPLMAATFSELPAPSSHSIAVFSEAYEELQRLPDRARLLSNALTVPGQSGALQMISGARPGASGSAVLDGGGLLLGMVVERVAAGSGGGNGSNGAEPGAGRAGMSTLVRAVAGEDLKQFLRQTGIPFAQSRVAQIGAQQSPASRASTLAVGIVCG